MTIAYKIGSKEVLGQLVTHPSTIKGYIVLLARGGRYVTAASSVRLEELR